MVPPGTPVPPVGGLEVVVPLVVVSGIVVDRVDLVVDWSVTVVPVSLESSAATMISAMPSPITRTIKMPTIHRVRVSTPATVMGGSAGSA